MATQLCVNVECTQSLGLDPDGKDARDQPLSNDSKGGADASKNQTAKTRMYASRCRPQVNGQVLALSKIIANINNDRNQLANGEEGPPGAVAKEHEGDNFARTTDANVASLKRGTCATKRKGGDI